jgi:hypothetical protein
MNAWVEQYLQAWMMGKQNNWARLLPLVEYAHNSWKHETTRQTPHELLLGFKPQVHIKFLPENVPASINQVQQLKDTQEQTQKLLESMQCNKDA